MHPKPNTHLFTNLSDVMNAILDGVDTDLTNSLQGNASPLKQLTDAVRQNIVTQVHTQLEKQLAPLEQNLLDITLNQQVHPTPDSIKVRALNVDVLPAAKAQLNGNPLANLQIGNAACAPVASAAVSPPQAAPPRSRTRRPRPASRPAWPRCPAHGRPGHRRLDLGADGARRPRPGRLRGRRPPTRRRLSSAPGRVTT